jgi:tetratricopeptide (TPR) repeat protein
MKRSILAFLILTILLPALFAQDTKEHNISVNTIPFASLPLGSSADHFKTGFGFEADAAIQPAGWKGFGLGAGLGYSMIPIQSKDSIYILGFTGGPVFSMPLADKFTLFTSAKGGNFIYDGMGWDPGLSQQSGYVLTAGGGGTFNITDPFSIGLGVSYNYYDQVYNGIGISIYGRLDFGVEAKERAVRDYSSRENKVTPMKEEPPKKEKGKGVELRDMNMLTLFPVLYKYYDNNPIGTVRVKNFEKKTAEDITIDFYMERYMDNPMTTGESFTLLPGEEKIIELYGLFTQDMMSITEGSKASALINLSYIMNDKNKSDKYNPVLELNNRNALTWDDDQKIASFITAKDPEILSFSKKVSNWMQGVENPAVDENLQKGIALFEAVKSYGIRYEVDPATPFSELSSQTEVVDFIQFPRQTLDYTTGDCDDLTALYTSLLESVGVETAIITIPGHIYMAFALKDSPDEVRKNYSRTDEFILDDNKAWVPVEITMFQAGFEDAWLEGAKEWRNNQSKSQTAFYPTHEAWRQYQAVGFQDNTSIDMPSRNDVTTAFVKTISRYVEQELWPQETLIKNQMADSSKKYIQQNKLAVLYARYGLYDKSLTAFKEINDSRTYVPALLNTGNIYYLRGDYREALSWYERVLETKSTNRKALLGSARCNHELENYGTVRDAYQKLKGLDPDLAQRFAYLDLKGEEGNRAADALGLKELVIWEEEE